MVVLFVRGLLRRPSLSRQPHGHAFALSTFTMLWPRNAMPPLTCDVDFIGGDFNMSAFSTVGDVFASQTQSFRLLATRSATCSRIQSFQLLVIHVCGVLVILEDSHRECAGFLIMPKRPYGWCVDSHGCYKFNNADLALGP